MNITVASSKKPKSSSASPMSTGEIHGALREAVQACNERGLYFAARWAAEALSGLPRLANDNRSDSRATRLPSTFPGQRFVSSWTKDLELNANIEVETDGAIMEEYDNYIMAKTFFDIKEFDRTAATLKGCTSHKSRFLRLYSRYLASALDNSTTISKEIHELEEELSEGYRSGTLDAFGKYLYELIPFRVAKNLSFLKCALTNVSLSAYGYRYGVVLIKLQQKSQALDVLVDSVNQYPFNWNAWKDLAVCLPTPDDTSAIVPRLPVIFMTDFFLSHVNNTEQNNHQEIVTERLNELVKLFPTNFPEAGKVFEELIQENPHRLDHLDYFSFVLFVTDNKSRLSSLAHSSALTDNYRPETCCIIGNYYSLKGEHEKAVVYLKRALRFDRSYSAAWTLLGHTYLEMKNTYAAVEAYRRAVDYDHRDYRAWNGLGQTYEVLKMHYYAISYYQRASTLRPYDGRIWCAMAQCYEFLDQDQVAIKCYTRALIGSDQEKVAIKKLPRLYKKIGDQETAAYYFREHLNQMREEQNETEERSEACLFLSEYEMSKGHLRAAYEYATEALQCASEQHQEDAKVLLRDIRNAKDTGDTSDMV
ncbi:anaphase-promoting complex component apc8 [Podila epicladia]|nr:anaphase-promoting complex component apc8 [Podila epicladia]